MRLALLTLILGCAGGSKGAAPLSLSAPDGQVLDPRLEGDPALTLQASAGDEPCTLDIHLRAPSGQTRSWQGEGDWSASWDGTDDDGALFDPGPARFEASCEQGGGAALDLAVVRLGVSLIDLDDGPDGAAVPLAWHHRSLTEREIVPIEVPELRLWGDDGYQLGDLDDNDGQPRTAPEPWTHPSLPPWDETPTLQAYNVPAAYVAGTHPGLSVTAGTTSVSPRTLTPSAALPEGTPPIRLWVDGLEATDGDGTWSAGATIQLQMEDALPETLGVQETDIAWRWQSWDGEGWVDVPGSQSTTHRIWRLGGQPQLRDGADLGFAPATVWIAALDELQPDLQDVPVETSAILDAIRDHINQDPYLIYNPSDDAYSNYSGAYIYWDYIWSDLGDWLDRTDGLDLYCHSVSCLFSVLAGHWGVYAPQQVLGVGFNTNYTRAAGTDTWTTWSFRSHSVVSPDDGLTLWDASIDLDGDGDPSSSPSEALAPRGLSKDEYLSLLTGDDIDIVNAGLCYFQ